MQSPTLKTPVEKCVRLCRFTVRMLGKFADKPPLAAVAAKLEPAGGALESAQQGYAAAVTALVPVRVDVRFADWTSGRAVRAAHRAAETADGQKGGRITTHLFPNGITPVVQGFGAAEVAELLNLEGRYDAATGFWPEAATEKAKIAAVRKQYQDALGARTTGMQQASNLRAARDVAKEDFLDAYGKAQAGVRGEFTRDRAMQELFFDRVWTESAVEDDGEGNDEEPGVGGGDPTPTA
ncbi:MAG: hypothetical protein IT373_06860 [Polyangiaceae bacterium]|nr:hypothetical protein [Polyangiaceae bacterium]